MSPNNIKQKAEKFRLRDIEIPGWNRRRSRSSHPIPWTLVKDKIMLKKRYYTMPIGVNAKRHRVWHEYSDFQWENMQETTRMLMYGDFTEMPGRFIGLSERYNSTRHSYG